MNRAQRRKTGLKIVNNMIKNRQANYERAIAKKQWGFGFMITNLIVAFTFGPWVWVPWDRR